MELIANYLGNYKNSKSPVTGSGSSGYHDSSGYQDNHVYQDYHDGPIIISSNNYYSWGDLLTFRYIGEKNVPPHLQYNLTDHDADDNQMHQPFGEFFTSPINIDQTVSAPIHLRYHTISPENPLTIIQNVSTPTNSTDAIVTIKIQNIESQDTESQDMSGRSKYIVIEDYSENVMVDIFIKTDVQDNWFHTSDKKFLLSSELLFMIMFRHKDNQSKAITLVIEASESFDQNLPQPSDIALEVFVENFINQVVEEVVSSLPNTSDMDLASQ